MKINTKLILSGVFFPSILSACLSPIQGKHSEQQERMLRCDQYIGDQREDCLRGAAVTIDDYNDDYKNYQKNKVKEATEDKDKE
jgi:hypothetical protein